MDSATIKVLLVDDDQGDFEMTRVMLSQARDTRFELDWVSTFEEALDAFQGGGHDAYLVDYLLEDRSGLDLLREAGERGVTSPLIMLTGRGDARVNQAAMAAGAADYLVKGEASPEALVHAIRRAVERAGISQPSLQDPDGLETLLHRTSTALAVLDDGGFILDANPAFRRFFALAEDETRGRSFLGLVCEDERPTVARELGALERGESFGPHAERRFSAGQDGVSWARVSFSLLRGSSGEPDRVFVILDAGSRSGPSLI